MRKDRTCAGEKLGIYIHIPFCRSKCDYCDFYSLAGQEARMDDYQKALLAHLKESALAANKIADIKMAVNKAKKKRKKHIDHTT